MPRWKEMVLKSTSFPPPKFRRGSFGCEWTPGRFVHSVPLKVSERRSLVFIYISKAEDSPCVCQSIPQGSCPKLEPGPGGGPEWGAILLANTGTWLPSCRRVPSSQDVGLLRGWFPRAPQTCPGCQWCGAGSAASQLRSLLPEGLLGHAWVAAPRPTGLVPGDFPRGPWSGGLVGQHASPLVGPGKVTGYSLAERRRP